MPNLNLKPHNVLIGPHISEKALLAADKSGVYAFKVLQEATKKSIAASVKVSYGVTPRQVRIVAIPEEKVFIRGKRGVKSGGKKAYVYLKKGDKIEIM